MDLLPINECDPPCGKGASGNFTETRLKAAFEMHIKRISNVFNCISNKNALSLKCERDG